AGGGGGGRGGGAGEAGKPLERGFRLGGGELGAADEEGRVLAARELLGGCAHLVEGRPGRNGPRTTVEGGASRHGGEQVDPRLHAVVARSERGQLERRRDQDRAVEADSRLLLQHPPDPPAAA